MTAEGKNIYRKNKRMSEVPKMKTSTGTKG